MDPSLQTLVTVSVPTLAVLIGILVNNSRLSDHRAHFDQRFSDFEKRMDQFEKRILAEFATIRSEILRVEQVMDVRLRHVEETKR